MRMLARGSTSAGRLLAVRRGLWTARSRIMSINITFRPSVCYEHDG